jgi:hypothetical protein
MAEVHMPHAAHDDGDRNPGVHHETTDVNISGILLFGVGLIVSAVLIYFVVWVLFKYFEAREARRVAPEYPLAATQEVRLPPEPRLQTNPRGDLQDLRAQEDQILNSYGWIDKNTGVVRIPIDEAMKLVVQRGLPARQGAK